MKKYLSIALSLALGFYYGCGQRQEKQSEIYNYGNILDIAYTPDNESYCSGWFSDCGSWMGFTIPESNKWVNGFCGPFNLETRRWLSSALVTVAFEGHEEEIFTPDSVSYFPGEVYMIASSQTGTIEQRMIYLDRSTILLQCVSSTDNPLVIAGKMYGNSLYEAIDNVCYLTSPTGEAFKLSFDEKAKVIINTDSYKAVTTGKKTMVVISMNGNGKEHIKSESFIEDIFNRPSFYAAKHHKRWEEYLQKVLRTDMLEDYNRIAVKAVVTLLSNWKSSRGGLLHEGVVPSHAVGYFMGFWAWDSWKHAVALAKFAPELAKNQVRAMFDYQLEDGMVIDCIYSDISENNARDSKPPLAAWAVYEIYKQTGDVDFVREMYPHLLSYYQWWYHKRDHDKNGICEFGSTDGTLEAAAWESGMDNAIRFDNAAMVQNGKDAWSFDQESVDLNAFLLFESKLLKKLAAICKQTFTGPEHTENIISYFFDEETGYFFDKKLGTGEFIHEEGSEGYIPFWTKLASKEQMDKAIKLFTDTTKFSTYIPFPTVAADNPKFMPGGYWRGPIWLDQTYFGISGLRKYGYIELADKYTCQVFDRLQGLKKGAPIHENYSTHTGERLKAPHFSWSSAHLLMLYWEYGKK